MDKRSDRRAGRTESQRRAPARAGHAKQGSPDRTGSAARLASVRVLNAILSGGHTLEDALSHAMARQPMASLDDRDKAFARTIVMTALRRRGQLEDVIARFLTKPLPNRCGFAREILLAGAAQILFLAVPAHAAVDVAVDLARSDERSRPFAGLINAVLRRLGENGPGLLAGQDAARLNTPDWLWSRWTAAYGEPVTRAIAEAHMLEPPLDLTCKGAAEEWAARLEGSVLPTGSVRLRGGGRVESLDGYRDGAWWVQDAGAAIPARLLGDVAGRRVVDLCAAPGGKTAQLANAGAEVTAVEISPQRRARLEENLNRVHLEATLVLADAATWRPQALFDAVLLDAPCTATGTIRRHPDVALLKSEDDVRLMSDVQARLLDAAVDFVKPGGAVVYCTCSLEPEEGERQIARLLSRRPDVAVDPIHPNELGAGLDEFVRDGMLRTLPCHMSGYESGLSGIDGFFAARLKRLQRA